MRGISEAKNEGQYDVCVARALNYARLGIAKEVMHHYPTWRVISRLYATHSDSLKRQGMYDKEEGDFANEVTQTMHEGNWDAEFVNTRVSPYIGAILDVGLKDDIEEADRARTRV